MRTSATKTGRHLVALRGWGRGAAVARSATVYDSRPVRGVRPAAPTAVRRRFERGAKFTQNGRPRSASCPEIRSIQLITGSMGLAKDIGLVTDTPTGDICESFT